MPFSRDETVAWIKTLSKRHSSGSVAMVYNQQVLVVKASYKSYWTMPGGIIEAHESPVKAAIREVLEEVGIALNLATTNFSFVEYFQSELMEKYGFVFESEITSGQVEAIKLQVSELTDYKFVDVAAILATPQDYSLSLRHWAQGDRGYLETSA